MKDLSTDTQTAKFKMSPVPSSPPRKAETCEKLPSNTPPPDYELLDAPIWVGQAGHESQTQHWFSIAEQGHSNDRMEDTQSLISDNNDCQSDHNQTLYEPLKHSQQIPEEEEGCSHTPSSMSMWDSSSDEAEVPAPFYIPASTCGSSSSDPEQRQQQLHKRMADCDTELFVKKRRLAVLAENSLSSSNQDEFLHHSFHPPCSPPPFSVSSSPSWTSRKTSPNAGSSRRHLPSLTFWGNYQQQMLLYSQAQMNAEYEDIARGPISNKEFLQRLKTFDEHWNMNGLDSSNTYASCEDTTPVLWRWWAAYVEAMPSKEKNLHCRTEEECEAVTLEIQDEYFECERMIDEETLRSFRKFEVAMGEEGITGPVLEAAQMFQTLVKGKFREGAVDEGTILVPDFEEGEVAASRKLVEVLGWHYQCKMQFFEDRYPAWLLGAVRELVDYGKLREGQNLSSLIGDDEDGWTVWPGDRV